MSDRVIEAIREVDPCPDELAPPPIELVHGRLQAERDGAGPARPRRRASLAALSMVASSVTAVAVAVVAIAVLGHSHRSPTPGTRGAGAGATGVAATGLGASACRSQARAGVLPPWARAGFSEARPRMVYALGPSGEIAAILWGPLDAPPAADHNNKILWVSRTPLAAPSDLRIEAQRMTGTRRLGRPVNRRVTGGPGPSIINVPAAGCWRMTLRWAGRTDHIDLQYGRPG